MSLDIHSAWREPARIDWRDEADRLTDELKYPEALNLESIGRRLRRLGAMQIGEREQLVLHRLVKRVRKLPAPLPGFRQFRLLLVSNRTLSFLAANIEAAGIGRGLLIETVETGYDSVRTLALNPATAAPAGEYDAVLFLVDADFFASGGNLLDVGAEAANYAAVQGQLDELIAGLRFKAKAPVIAATIACPPDFQHSTSDRAIAGTSRRLLHAINEAIVDNAKAGQSVLFDMAAVAERIGSLTFFDAVQFHHAKTPFSMEAGPVVADAFTALIAAMSGRAGRLLVLDLDNTLWGGVVADDGVEGIVLGQGSAAGEAFLSFQRYVLELRRRGVALAVCSKNMEAIAREPFRSHPDMLLREEHLSTFVANFEDKATNIARIAAELDLDPSSVVFVDDNPAERERVRSSLPHVMVPEIGSEPAHFARLLCTSGYFEHLLLTGDDTRRAEAYQARAAARALQATVGDYGAYLQSLEMEMTIAPFDALGRARIAQLIQKSNQFNLTTRRYSELRIAEMESDDIRFGWQIRLKDRFADHGMICVVIVERHAQAWEIDTWVMSCRVLERGVERAVMDELIRFARKSQVGKLQGCYRPTPRNELVKDFYPRLGFTHTGTLRDEAAIYELNLACVDFSPAAMSINILDAAALK